MNVQLYMVIGSSRKMRVRRFTQNSESKGIIGNNTNSTTA